MNDKQLTVIPTGGLANRMLAIASAYCLSKATNRNLKIIWQKKAELNASFYDLFKDESHFDIREINPFLYALYYDSPRKKNLFVPKILHGLSSRMWIYFINGKNSYMTDEYFLDIAQKSVENINIMSCYPFYDEFNTEILNKIFKPSLKVEARIKEILNNNIPEKAIQIRRTDHSWSIENSPLSLFEKIMDKEISQNSNIKLFLATDDQEIKNALATKYRNNLIYNPIKASRDNIEGMIDGAAEMFIMSKCKQIYGSYNSTYSYFASLIGDVELTVVKKT